MKKRPGCWLVLAWSVMLALAAESIAAGDVEGLLERLARNADTYREHALKFGCEETIRWSWRTGRGSVAQAGGRERFGYVFIYDEDGEGFTDYRTPFKRHAGKKPPRRVSPEEFKVPRYLRSAYLWIFSFKRDRWPRHRYESMGEETVLGRPATKLVFEPVAPIEDGINDWYGTAWVDLETAQLLKIEAYTPDEHRRMRAMERQVAGEAVDPRVVVIERITTWFEIEAHGLRFPSRVEIRRVDHHLEPAPGRVRTRSEPVLEVDQSYRSYEFFGVRTREELEPVGEVDR